MMAIRNDSLVKKGMIRGLDGYSVVLGRKILLRAGSRINDKPNRVNLRLDRFPFPDDISSAKNR
jgi:hypothetical protein